MKLARILLAPTVLAILAGAAAVAGRTETTAAKMAEAAGKFLASLAADQRAKTTFAFEDKERLNWHFVPLEDRKTRQPTRKGLPLAEMTAAQKQAALRLLRTGTSGDGYTQATTIMSLEALLHELEKGAGPTRNPEWYFFTIFGTPGRTGKWGWRVEGHHLSLNFTIDQGRVVASTPAVFGANPATVKDGPRKGLRTLAAAEDLARQLFESLDEDQKKTAYQQERFPEIAGRTTAPKLSEPKGLPAGRMSKDQRELLLKLLQSYANRLAPELAAAGMNPVTETGIDRIHFAFNGSTKEGQPHTYRIQGPTFVVEFLNEQPDGAKNPANHIHSGWRNLRGDFGLAAN